MAYGAPDPAAAQQPANPLAGLMEQPAFTITEQGGGSGTETSQISPEHQEQIDNQGAAQAAAIKAQRALGTNAVDKADANAQALEDRLPTEDQYVADRRKAIEEEDKKIAEKQQEYAERRQNLETASKGRQTTYWQDKGKPAELFSIFITGLSEASNITAGGKYGDSPMAHYFEKALADDEKKKLAAFEDSKMFATMAKEDAAAARTAKTDRLTEIKDEHVVMIENMIKKAEAYAAKLGTAEAKAKAAAEIAKMRETQAKSLADQLDVTDKKVRTESGRTTTVTNIKDPNASGNNKPSDEDVRKREQLKIMAKQGRDDAEILGDEQAGNMYRALVKNQQWSGDFNSAQKGAETGGGIVGGIASVGRAALAPLGNLNYLAPEGSLLVMPPRKSVEDAIANDIKDEKMRKRVSDYYAATERMITHKAIMNSSTGNPTDEDRRVQGAEIAPMARTSADMAKLSLGVADGAQERLDTIEANRPGVANRTAAAAKTNALANLIRITSIRGAGKSALDAAAAQAKAAGVDESTVDDLVRKAGKRR